ncbi:MAG: transposase [Phycisphaeraceae bacterium]|nr:transposase [Phycisphaeraceae bacterium]MCW5761965.1 transposase [Phycisphaeraceae bacterium]
MTMHEIVIATQNPGKVAELRALLADLPVRVLGLGDVGGTLPEPEETGRTFEDNAAIKALTYASWTGMACLADDSGLEVDALGGAPGVDSAWYAYASEAEAKSLSREVRDAANNERLLRELEGVPLDRRGARFVCCMVVAGFAVGNTPQVDQGGRLPAVQRVDVAGSSHGTASGPKRTGDLPHWELPNQTYHVTFRLRAGTLTPAERQVVLDACLHWQGVRALVHALVVMPDHVHMIVRLIGPYTLPALMHSIKSYSSQEIQKMRGQSGSLWQREYYDRIIRGQEQQERTYRYIEENPVKEGLVEKPGEYLFLWRQVCGRLEAAPPDGAPIVLAVSRGTFDGRIGEQPRVPAGVNGFGYDPLFLVGPECGVTSAELPPARKNQLSHRAAAAREIARQIRTLVAR